MITTEEAIAMAREAFNRKPPFVMTEVQQLTALCNLVRAKTLEEAADAFQNDPDKYNNPIWSLRRMAKGE